MHLRLTVYLLLFGIQHFVSSLKSKSTVSNVHTKVVRGRDARPGEFPYIVALRFDNPSGFLFCAGSLIHPRYVLTVHHCIQEITRRKLNWTMTMNTDNKRNITDKQKFYMRDYFMIGKGNPPYHDALLIRLNQAVDIPGIRPVKLSKERKYSLPGTQVIIAGWGMGEKGDYPANLRVATTQIVKDAKCENTFRKTYDKKKYLCTGTKKGSICSGDSGGPLIVKLDNGEEILVGLSSFGSVLCILPSPAGFSRVALVRKRIQKTLQKNGDELI